MLERSKARQSLSVKPMTSVTVAYSVLQINVCHWFQWTFCKILHISCPLISTRSQYRICATYTSFLHDLTRSLQDPCKEIAGFIVPYHPKMSGFLYLFLSHVLLWLPDLSQSGNASYERSRTFITSCGKVAQSSDDALRLPEAKVNATYLDALWIDEFQGLRSSQCSSNAFVWCVLCLLLGVSPWILLVWGGRKRDSTPIIPNIVLKTWILLVMILHFLARWFYSIQDMWSF